MFWEIVYAFLSLQRKEQESHVNTEIQLFGTYNIYLNKLQAFGQEFAHLFYGG